MQSINPATNRLIAEYPDFSQKEIEKRLGEAHEAFLQWSKLTFEQRRVPMRHLAKLLRDKVEICARMITAEMGKPIQQSRAEVLKSAAACEYYADHTAELLKPESKAIEKQSYTITFEPLGVILGIMPWNYPIWQVCRFGIPTLMAGNAIILKHAPNVSGCALLIESLIAEAGFPKHLLRVIITDHKNIPALINNSRITGVALTGSDRAGMAVGAEAGKALKKCVLELGGSDPFIVLDDANLNECVPTAVNARLQNCGQSCIAAKRFIIVSSLYERFCREIKQHIQRYKVGDPLQQETEMGPLAREDLLKNLERQVKESIAKGAVLEHGGKRLKREGCFYEPTILTQVTSGMPAYNEEIFGPVFAMISVDSPEEAVQVANDSMYGLGASLWTQNQKVAQQVAQKIEAGMVCINAKTVSVIQLPFGGIKRSGYGRELSMYGIKEFVNIKTIATSSC